MTARAETSNDSPERYGQCHRCARRVRRADAGQDARAVLGRRARPRGDESRVVDQLSVVGEQPAAQPVAAHSGRHLDCARGVDPPGTGQHR